MSINATVLFDQPQSEIGSLIAERMTRANAIHIVTGFATPRGLAALEEPIVADPGKVKTIVVGAATYPAFQTLDSMNNAGVPLSKLFVHLGHTRPSRSNKHPTARYHPMLHSKIFHMEFADRTACAFVGSHNLTSFALNGQNGEAGTLLEGSIDSVEFEKIRNHIRAAKGQSVQYHPTMKDAYAWWTRESIDGLRAEMRLPVDWITGRTILIFAQASKYDRLRFGQTIYFEIPAGIEQIHSLETETHLFLFETMPSSPQEALRRAADADASYTCKTLGADNERGNLEVVADWQITGNTVPTLNAVSAKLLRPTTSPGVQQVRAKVKESRVARYEYRFERVATEWEPKYADMGAENLVHSDHGPDRETSEVVQLDRNAAEGWMLVEGLVPREDDRRERDAPALELATPDSGRFILVFLQQRKTS